MRGGNVCLCLSLERAAFPMEPEINCEREGKKSGTVVQKRAERQIGATVQPEKLAHAMVRIPLVTHCSVGKIESRE